MSDLPDEVLDRAVEAAMPDKDYKWPELVKYLPYMVRAAAPVLIEAERDRIKTRIELARRRLIALMQAAEKGSGLIPAEVLESRLQEIFAALSVIDEEGGEA